MHKAITIHVSSGESGASHFWELRDINGTLVADSVQDGEFGCFATQAGAFADAAKIAAVYMEYAARFTV